MREKLLLRPFFQIKGAFILSCFLFALGIWFGASSQQFQEFLQSQLDNLGMVARQFGEMKYSQLWLGIFIFLNNTIKSIAVMYLGLLFGLVPIIFILVNGMLIGFLLTSLHGQGEHVLDVVVRGLLPHGIIEIPAILFAAAYGLKLGGTVMQCIFLRPNSVVKLKELLRLTLPSTLLLVVLLFIAAIVESTITVWLLQIS